MIAIGEYPAIGLADARKIKDEYKALLAQNIDPLDWGKQQQAIAQEENSHTLEKVATRWIAIKERLLLPTMQMMYGVHSKRYFSKIR